MNRYSQKATEYFKQGYNCAQSVFCTFSEEFGIDFETSLKLSSSFGGGMGRLREVCGAVSAMFMVVGLKHGYTEPNNDEVKENHYKRVQKLAQEFEKINGSIICRELLNLDIKHDIPTPEKRSEQYYKNRPCAKLVESACEILYNYILNQ